MPTVIHTPQLNACSLPELIETLKTGRFDARDEDCFASFGAKLKQLGNNRSFLADCITKELKHLRADETHRSGGYGSQVFVLHAAENFIIRANFWPGQHDTIVSTNGARSFFYHVPHDHNFSFLTIGYAGPGYTSDYYEYDYHDVHGYIGEKVDLRFIEQSRLDQGKVMLYRAHKDVHSQHPPESMSISLNIMETNPSLAFRDQYGFDLTTSSISEILTVAPIEQLLALCTFVGDGNSRDLVYNFARHHPSDRVRLAAVKATARAAATLAERTSLLEKFARRENMMVSKMLKLECDLIDSTKSWIHRTESQ